MLTLVTTTKKKMIKHAWYKKKHAIQLQRCKLVLLKKQIVEAINYNVKLDRHLQYSLVLKSCRVLLDSILREIVSLVS